MFNFFKRNKQGKKAKSSVMSQLESEPTFQIHRQYWTFNQQEYDQLKARFNNDLSEKEKLRLLHLLLLEFFESTEGQQCLNDDSMGAEEEGMKGEALTIVNQIVNELQSGQMFSSKKCFLWQGDAGASQEREPDSQGDLINPSFTHLGCIEVIKMDDQQAPKAVEFIPLDDIRGILFAPPSLFRAAKILYEDERNEEIVYIPLNYGFSWLSNSSYDHDGSMTRFCSHIQLEDGSNIGVGIGQQDLQINNPEGNMSLMGISSVGELMVGLEVSDPRFEMKCKARGLDPQDVLKQVEQ